ncbi:allene oxide cyclase barrel-like domain-containing protein [Dactylosporangium sp. CS-047395]|uniref:allene oxide cyclase barrel-like domain-containing protein n=1 Tax=Dactylosporangium sp. CS-047395 TaxID=3239936 RepID=UPI003D8B1AB2
MSRLTHGSLIVLTAVVLGASGAPAGADTAAPPVRLVGQQTAVTQLDLGAAGPGQGDEVVFTGLLFDVQHRPLGRFHGVLVAVDAAGDRSQAQVTLVLPGGQIAVQGEVDFAAPDPVVHAITGGTGRYAGAGGTFAFRHTDQPGVIDISLDVR